MLCTAFKPGLPGLYPHVLVAKPLFVSFCLHPQAGTFVQLLDGDDSDEKAVTAMGILNTLETMLNVMERSKEVHILGVNLHQ